MALPSRFWADLTTLDFAGLDPAATVAVLPVGATEQHGPHPAIIQGDIWELPAVHQMLAALDECHLARQQNLMVAGEEQQRASIQLQEAEHELNVAKAALLRALEELPEDENHCPIGTILDIEAAWESNLLLPAGLPPAQGHFSS